MIKEIMLDHLDLGYQAAGYLHGLLMEFITDLWNSILTPGTTPALVKATHGSFIGLVAVLLGMLVATRSLHFVALLVISLGLWAAITWFIAEVARIKEEEERQKKEDASSEAVAATGTTTGTATGTSAAKPKSS